jgi:hypothetical protein
MLQILSVDIRECYLHAEQCRRWAEVAPTPTAKVDFLDMERRWLSLAHNYEFAERLSDSTDSKRKQQKPFSKLKQQSVRRSQARSQGSVAGTVGRVQRFKDAIA